MSIPLATTTISVLRVPGAATTDPWDAPGAAQTVASGVRAVIGRPRGNEGGDLGTQEVVDLVLTCDPTDIEHTDRIQDEQSLEIYEAVWVQQRQGPNAILEHTSAGLRRVTGVASRPAPFAGRAV